MAQGKELSLFNGITIRRIWHKGEWYYSIVDIVAALTQNEKPSIYWSKVKKRARAEGFAEGIEPLKLKSADGKLRETDTANRETILRLIQSVPSPNAEPFRIWLAQVGEERFQEIEDPSLMLERMRQHYRKLNYPEEWIEQRIRNDIVRNDLTDEWRERGAKEGVQFAVLTNEIHEGTFEVSIQAHKTYKLLPSKTNLRDHMTVLELALLSLGEATAITLHQDRDTQGFEGLKKDSREAGTAAGRARKEIEQSVGHPVVSNQNF